MDHQNRDNPQQESRPERRVFKLTTAGQEAFQNWLFSPVMRPRQMRQEFQAKLFFAQLQGREACEQLITLQHQACCQWLTLRKKTVDQESQGRDFVGLVYQYRAGQIQAMLDWLDTCQAKLGEPL